MAKKQETEIQEDGMLDVGDELRVYELGFHIDPELPTEEVKKAYHTIRALVESKGTIIAEGEPQMVQLAYTISRQETTGRRDFNSAYFSWIAYEVSASQHAEIIATVNADKHLVRFIDLVTTKDAARHAVEIREFTAKAPEHTEEAEVAEGELEAALQSAIV